MKKILLLAVTATSLLGSCKKDDKKDSSTGTEAKIADKKWKLTAHSYVFNGQTNDGYAQLKDCQKDNFAIYSSDKSIIIDEGATKCMSSTPQMQTVGTWELRSGGKELFLSGAEAVYGIKELTLNIIESSSSTLKVKYTTTVNGPVIENTATYTAL
ncbi:MAG TPA: hypothetical protein VL092_05560 [Chitinophagaceae bacterium]|nr:hypothetical protein [Chitinophagaceae bacterium]